MYQLFNRYKILRVFFDNPNKKFYLRELSRYTKISLPSVKKHVEELLKLELIQEQNEGLYKGYKSSINSTYRILKRNDLLIRLEESGLIKELEKKCTPNCIVLYGSAVEGRDDERGDIDIFVQSNKKNIDLKDYENILNRKISLLFEKDTYKINKTFKNTLVNGIVLKGYFKVI
jgi:predicted nucleotidyltransferase